MSTEKKRAYMRCIPCWVDVKEYDGTPYFYHVSLNIPGRSDPCGLVVQPDEFKNYFFFVEEHALLSDIVSYDVLVEELAHSATKEEEYRKEITYLSSVVELQEEKIKERDEQIDQLEIDLRIEADNVLRALEERDWAEEEQRAVQEIIFSLESEIVELESLVEQLQEELRAKELS